MKTYSDIMEVMAMSDMNKIAGGTDHQRKIAQDRQRKREAKNKGFDPKKSVLADKDPLKKAAPGVKSPTAPTKASAATDPLKKAAPGVKAPTAPTKASAATDPLKRASSSAIVKSGPSSLKKPSSSAIVKSEPSSIEKRRPDVRKSQIGKWSQGIKSNPSAITKAKPSSVTKAKTPVEKVNVKVEPPKKQPVKDERQAPGRRRVPDKTYPAMDKEKGGINFGATKKPKTKKPNKFMKGVSRELKNRFGKENLGRKATSAVLDAPGKIGRAAINQNKNQRKVGSSRADDVEQAELRMYGDERF